MATMHTAGLRSEHPSTMLVQKTHSLLCLHRVVTRVCTPGQSISETASDSEYGQHAGRETEEAWILIPVVAILGSWSWTL